MEFWQNDRKVAFTTLHNGAEFFVQVGDVQVMEEHSIGAVKFLHTASFRTTSDARTYLTAKYPSAEVR